MKHLNLLFLFLVLSRITALAQAQVFVDMLQSKKWFEVEDCYQQNKDSIGEVLTLWYLAETDNVFNRPAEAINAYEQLIDMNPFNSIVHVMALFGQPVLQLCNNVQEYAKGEELGQKLIAILQQDTTLEPDIRLSIIQDFTQSIERFKLFPRTEIIKKKDNSIDEIELITNQSSNGIFFNAKWNGVNLKTFFDTGVSGGAFIGNRAIAEKIGVKLLNTTDTIMANENIRGLLGVVDSLEFGEFSIKNVPVFVNVESIDPTDSSQVICDSIYNSKFDIILGMSIIRQLGVVEFDFVKNTMSFPEKAKTFNKRNLYIEDSKLFMNTKICNVDFLTFFDTGGEQGLSINTDFYEKYKQNISIETQAKQTRSAVGSCNKESIKL